MLSTYEAQHIIQSLKPSKIKDIGSNSFQKQSQQISQLNVQAHLNFQKNEFDFITDHFLNEDKAMVLVHELIVLEAWKEKISPLLWPELVKFHEKSFRPYFTFYHEATVANLLEFILYNTDLLKTENMQDVLVDLVDYCYRKFTRLLREESPPIEKPSKESLLQESLDIQFKKSTHNIEFSCQMCALSIFRYITDVLGFLSPSVVTRILDTHDMILTLVYIIEKAPWKKRGPDGYYFFKNNQWVKAAPEEYNTVQQHEAQAWLSINNLLCDRESTRRYEYNPYRKDTVLRLTKYLNNNLLLDQIPVLVDTQRHVSQLQILNPPASQNTKILYIEQISQIRNEILKEDFDEIAQDQTRSIFKPLDQNELKKEVEFFSKMFDHLADLNIGGQESDFETISK